MQGLVARLVGALCVLLACEVAATALYLALPPSLEKARRSSPVVLDRRGAWLRALPVENGRWRVRAAPAAVDPTFVRRLIAMEDARFFAHHGVDPMALVRAAASDLTAGRIRSGGSTLTMQLARRLQPQRRTVGAKLAEALRAVELEMALGKPGVLADYLTLAPYGGNLEGVEAASLAYFGHSAGALTDAEQALLIALPQAPEARRPDRHPAAARAARSRILGRLQTRRLISPLAAADAAAEPLPRRVPLPSLAWQTAGQLGRLADARQPAVRSTLDAGLQARLEPMAAALAKAQGPTSSVAILVVEAGPRAVRASVGSAGRDRPGGWMDATRALRSPGSSLKPFIYAMAFESGLAAPETRIADARTGFGGYRPQNFDRTFHGEVTAREALQSSLNVPAVTLLSQVGAAPFAARLKAAGVELVRPRAKLAAPSLAFALGGEGVSMRDLALLYASLAEGGVAKPLAWTEADAARTARAPGVQLVSAPAAEQVLDILRGGSPPEGRAPPSLGLGAPRLAFKTGTSYGFRDAVAAGVGGGYVVVVWTGRPDGGPRPGMTGREAALPLLFDIFDLLKSSPANAPPSAPQWAPPALVQAQARPPGPHVVFPPSGASLTADGFGAKARGFVLAADGEAVRWYVDGAPVATDRTADQTVWRPPSAGFYWVEAVDAEGRRARVKVRIRG